MAGTPVTDGQLKVTHGLCVANGRSPSNRLGLLGYCNPLRPLARKNRVLGCVLCRLLRVVPQRAVERRCAGSSRGSQLLCSACRFVDELDAEVVSSSTGVARGETAGPSASGAGGEAVSERVQRYCMYR
jgi:hypothetical protein